MGDRLRVKVVSAVALVAVAATALVIACGSDEASIDSPCEGASCDGGASESSTADGPGQEDGNTLPKDAGADALADADADSSVVANCGDGGPPGTLDESFGTGGLVRLSYATSSANAVAIQADGKIVIGGDTPTGTGDSLAVVRLLQDGSLDPTFGNNGLVETTVGTLSQSILGVAVQGDGKILAVGRTRNSGEPFKLTVVRHLPNGNLDATFGDGGVVLTDTPSNLSGKVVAVQPDGRIVVGADRSGSTSDYVIVRYGANGTLDSTFGTGGSTSIDVRSTGDIVGGLAITPTGQIVVGGYSVDPNDTNRADMTAVRREADGGADLAFGTSGSFVSNFGIGATAAAYDVALDGNGRVLLAGAWKSAVAPDDFAVARITSSGALDTTWGDAGLVTTDFQGRTEQTGAVLVQADGKIIVVGPSIPPGGASDTMGIALARYLNNGALDATFGVGGKTLTLPAPTTNLHPLSAALSACTVVVVGSWGYNQNTVNPQYAMGVARYRR